MTMYRSAISMLFLSTPSARRATHSFSPAVAIQFSFLSTPSARRATNNTAQIVENYQFLSTPSARRATFFFL